VTPLWISVGWKLPFRRRRYRGAVNADPWRAVLVVALAFNAVAGFGYRIYRVTKGGPLADVVGQGVLGVVLGATAAGIAAGVTVARWVALSYGVLFGLAVMPVWTLAVLIPMRPGGLDYAFTAAYWACLAAIVVAAVFL
jgi:hypothetical protein